MIAHFKSLLQRRRLWARSGLVPRQRAHLEAPAERWQVTLYTIVIAETLAMLGFMLSLPFLPFYIQQLGVTDLQQITFWVAVLNSVPTLTMAVAAPFWGVLADRRGRKPMLIRAMLGGSLVLSAMGFVTSVVQLTGLRVIEGTLTGTVTAATTLVASNVPRERTGYALGLLQAGIFIASWLGPSLGGLIAGTFGYRVAFLTSGAMLLAAALLTFFLVSEHFVPVKGGQRVGRSLFDLLARGAVRSDLALHGALVVDDECGQLHQQPDLSAVRSNVGARRERRCDDDGPDPWSHGGHEHGRRARVWQVGISLEHP